MSYTSGIGASQVSNAAEITATSRTAASAKPDTSTAASANDSSSIGNDQASLSSTGALVAQALSGSDVRADKVAALQQSIAAGTYSVSSSDVADKLIQSLQK